MPDQHMPEQHRYLSTACLHATEPGRQDLHAYCQAPTGNNTAGQTWTKKPGECKFCDAPCTCPCHQH